MQTAGREARAAWRRTEAALAEAVRARRATERSKLELVEALIAERAGRVLLAQEVCSGNEAAEGGLVHNRRSGLREANPRCGLECAWACLLTHAGVHSRHQLPVPQAGGADRGLLVLLADEQHALNLVLETVRQLQGAAAAPGAAGIQGAQPG